MVDRRLARLAATAPEVLRKALRLLESGAVDLDVPRARLAHVLRAPDDRIDEVHRVFRQWAGSGAPVDALAATMRTALAVRDATLERAPRCSIAWTGRGGTGTVRSTVPVILEMLERAEHRVLLLSYSVWLAQSKVNNVLGRLAQLSSAGVEVVWIFDAGYRDGHNFTEITRYWPAGHRRPTVYSWRDVDDEIAKLHAKVLVVDERDALVTSANLTGHGLTSNIEIGVRVEGRPAEDLAGHLLRLVADGTFERYDWG